MARPHAPEIVLDQEAQQVLQALVRAHATPQALAFRCELILGSSHYLGGFRNA